MRNLNSYICPSCGFKGLVAEQEKKRRMLLWDTMVCNKAKSFVAVLRGYTLPENYDQQMMPTYKMKSPAISTATRLNMCLNKCPLHHDTDVSEIVRNRSSEIICPKCAKAMKIA